VSTILCARRFLLPDHFLLWISTTKRDKIRVQKTPSFRSRNSSSDAMPMNSFWRHCLARFEKELPSQQYKTWIKPLRVAVNGNCLTLIAPNRFVLQWIRDKFLVRIEQLAREQLQQAV
jgi:hypothetical protein